MRITVNVCRDAARSGSAGATRSLTSRTRDHRPIARPLCGLARNRNVLILQRALDSLPEKERLAIVLRDIEGLSTAEVASILQSSETTVRSAGQSGRLRLKAVSID